MDYEKFLNKTVASLPPSGIRKFFDAVSVMPDVISLGVGEPDFVTPWTYRAAAIESIRSGETHYTPNRGIAKLITQIGIYLNDRFDLSYDDDEIMVTVGASEALDLALRTLVSVGDEVLVPDPAYVSYCPNISLAGGVARPIPVGSGENFKLTVRALEAALTPRTRVLILPYPNNPTGGVLKGDDLRELSELIVRKNLFVISDEIYAELTYGSRHVSIASLPGMRERTVVVNGFSKAFAMTGWRLGFAAAPEPVLSQMLKIHQYVIMCAPTAAQKAAYSALVDGHNHGYEEIEKMRAEYDNRRRFSVGALNDMGLDCFMPEGAFYVFPSVKRFNASGDDFANGLLEGGHVAVVPGSAFGSSCVDHVRCTYAASLKELMTAFDRIDNYLHGKPFKK